MPVGPTVWNNSRMDAPGRSRPYMPPDYKIYLLNKRLHDRVEDCDNLWWDSFANEFFEDKSTLTISVYMDDGPKQYSIGRTLIPRYFRTIFDGGATDLEFALRHPKDMYNPGTNGINMDCEHTTMVTHHLKPIPTKVYTEGHLMIEFVYDDLMRIKSWHFAIRSHSELIPKQTIPMQDPAILEEITKGITKQGMTSCTINYLRLCVILEPMKEVMSRQKTYNIDPRDCLRNCLFQKWQRMMNPPGPVDNLRQTKRPSRKRKISSSSTLPNQSVAGSKKKSFLSSEVMVVGEPMIAGGEFGDEDERMITRLENQFEPNCPVKMEHQEPVNVANFSHSSSPDVAPNGSQASWQSHLPSLSVPHTQTGMNGQPLSSAGQQSSGPATQNSSMMNNGQDTIPNTPSGTS